MDDNKRLFLWLNPDGCYHEWGYPISSTGFKVKFRCQNKCGEAYFRSLMPSNPDYSTESGFFTLLDGLRAKGFGVELRHQSENCLARLVKYADIDADYDLDSPQTFVADTLPQALFQAAIKVMESEQPTGEGVE